MPEAKAHILMQEVDGNLVLYDSKKDAVHTLNPTAQLVWDNLADPPDQIAKILQKTYHVATEKALQDVKATLEQFQSLDLLQEPPQT